jgi:hypothetical protein
MTTQPTAFDTSLGSNFTNTDCPNFFNTFLSDQNFIQCQPLSFLLKNSQSYVKSVRSGVEDVEAVLDKSCTADYNKCQNIMKNYASKILDPSICKQDFDLENPLVRQAYQNFLNYGVVRNITCLRMEDVGEKDPAANETYCYTDALYNQNNIADAYLYLLPFGNSYPKTENTKPSCSACTNRVMSLLHEQTQNKQLLIASTYTSASSLIAVNCGNDFVNISTLSSSQLTSSASSSFLLLASPIQLMIWALFTVFYVF